MQKSRVVGDGEDADTQVRRRARAHPRATSGGPATKNRSKRMRIIGEAVSLCITIILAPQRGQCQREEASEEVAQATVSARVGELPDSSCRDSAKRELRQRLARNPK